jgi:hypothetical protein
VRQSGLGAFLPDEVLLDYCDLKAELVRINSPPSVYRRHQALVCRSWLTTRNYRRWGDFVARSGHVTASSGGMWLSKVCLELLPTIRTNLPVWKVRLRLSGNYLRENTASTRFKVNRRLPDSVRIQVPLGSFLKISGIDYIRGKERSSMHHILIFDDSGPPFRYIHHNTDDPLHDKPGEHVELKSGKDVKFKSPNGDLTIRFKRSSPFVSGTTTLTARRGTFTTLQTTKTIPSLREVFPYTAKVGSLSHDPDIIIDDGGGGSDGKTGKKTAKKKPKKKAKKMTKKKK